MAKTKLLNDLHTQCMTVLHLVMPLAAAIDSADEINDSHKAECRKVDAELHKMGQLVLALEKHMNSWDGSTSLKTKLQSQAKLAEARKKAKASCATSKTLYLSMEKDFVAILQEMSRREWTPARPATGPRPAAPPRPAQGPAVAVKH